MSIDFSTLSQHRLLAERVKNELSKIEDKTDLLSVITTALDTYIDGVNDKIDDLFIPTKTSELNNDAKFQTDTDVATAIANADKLTRRKIDSLSEIDLTADDAEDFIYMLGVTDTDGNTYYQQYMVINGAVEAMGTTKVDLEGYLTEDDVVTDEEVDEETQSENFDLGFFIHLPPEMHRTIFRGKNLGNVLTAKQKSAIKDGTFDDLWLGDYWVINGITWRIADIDYWWNRGSYINNEYKNHHLLILPDSNVGSAKRMDENIDVDYYHSELRSTGLNDAKEICTAAFGDNILMHSFWDSFSFNGKIPTDGSWCYETVSLLSDIMAFGLTDQMLHRTDTSRISLFCVKPSFISNGSIVWTRSKIDDYFITIDAAGSVNYATATSIRSIRPYFSIGVKN